MKPSLRPVRSITQRRRSPSQAANWTLRLWIAEAFTSTRFFKADAANISGVSQPLGEYSASLRDTDAGPEASFHKVALLDSRLFLRRCL